MLLPTTLQGKWGVTEDELGEQDTRGAIFLQETLPQAAAQIKVIGKSFQDMMCRFLIMLSQHADANLRFLAVRLDFNQHYRR